MKIFDCTDNSKGKGFKILDDSEYVCGITVNSAKPYRENKSINTRIGLNNLKLVQKD